MLWVFHGFGVLGSIHKVILDVPLNLLLLLINNDSEQISLPYIESLHLVYSLIYNLLVFVVAVIHHSINIPSVYVGLPQQRRPRNNSQPEIRVLPNISIHKFIMESACLWNGTRGGNHPSGAILRSGILGEEFVIEVKAVSIDAVRGWVKDK